MALQVGRLSLDTHRLILSTRRSVSPGVRTLQLEYVVDSTRSLFNNPPILRPLVWLERIHRQPTEPVIHPLLLKLLSLQLDLLLYRSKSLLHVQLSLLDHLLEVGVIDLVGSRDIGDVLVVHSRGIFAL